MIDSYISHNEFDLVTNVAECNDMKEAVKYQKTWSVSWKFNPFIKMTYL